LRDWANPDDPSISTFDHRGNVRVLRDALWTSSERLLVVAHSSRPGTFFRSALVAVTSARDVFVVERAFRRPFVVASIPFDQIYSAKLSEQPVTGTITLETSHGTIAFRHISPKERTWPLYWRISERIGQLPLREHS
jgi:hypothetical protein